MAQSVIVISRWSAEEPEDRHGDPESTVPPRRDRGTQRRTFEDAVIRRLGESTGASVLVVPSVYSMTDSHAGIAALKEISDDIVFASWLHPRAACWLLRARGIEGELAPSEGKTAPSARKSPGSARTIRPFNLAAFDSPETCAAELLRAAGSSASSVPGSVREIQGDVAPRWYPVLDSSACVACRQCYDFCLFGVYTLDGKDRPAVMAPDRCKPGCAACARICPEAAILFPLYETDEGIAGASGKRPAAGPIDADAFFARSGGACPVCGCACDCERWTGGPLPEGKTVCPACGCLCSATGPCACKEKSAATPKSRTAHTRSARAKTPDAASGDQPDELDGLIDALDELDF